ncbi:MAG TPA: hypothetical protein VLL98_02775 [Rickettsiales bacterium]|nr:hypothetical protein [Rickettsiales bacterium]
MKKIRIVFLYRGLSFWLNNHSLYKECLWDGNFDIWVVPESNSIDLEILQMLKNDKVHIIEKNIKDEKYFDLKRLNPDYVLIATPYKSQRNKIYNSEYLSKFTKVLYIPYGPYVYNNYNKSYLLNGELINCYKIFLNSTEEIENFSKYLNKNNLLLSSHPIYDLFYTNKYIKDFNLNKKIWNFEKSNDKKRILWTPHWTIESWEYLDNFKEKKGNSDFTKYADLWLRIPKMYPNLDIIMRPHPNLFTQLPKESKVEWNSEGIKKWKQEFEKNNNAKIDNNSNYIEQFLSSDAFINSSLSFTNLLINTLKPILSVRNISESSELNMHTSNIEKSYYIANNEQDIIDFLDNIVFKGKDIMLENRKKALKENIHIPDVGVGYFIKEYLIHDYFYGENTIKNSNIIKNLYRKIYGTK